MCGQGTCSNAHLSNKRIQRFRSWQISFPELFSFSRYFFLFLLSLKSCEFQTLLVLIHSHKKFYFCLRSWKSWIQEEKKICHKSGKTLTSHKRGSEKLQNNVFFPWAVGFSCNIRWERIGFRKELGDNVKRDSVFLSLRACLCFVRQTWTLSKAGESERRCVKEKKASSHVSAGQGFLFMSTEFPVWRRLNCRKWHSQS